MVAVTVVRQDTVLPGSQLPAAMIAGRTGQQEWAVVRYGGTVIVGHPGGMTVETAREFGAALFELAAEGTSAE